MVPAWYLLLTVLAQGFVTWLLFRIFADDHRTAINALLVRNPQEMKLLQEPAPSAPRTPKRLNLSSHTIRTPENEGEFPERVIRPMGI